MRAKPVEVSCVRLPVSEPRLARARSQQKPRRCVSAHATRRHLIGSVATLGAAGALARPAQAGLVMFPPEELNNNYILVCSVRLAQHCAPVHAHRHICCRAVSGMLACCKRQGTRDPCFCAAPPQTFARWVCMLQAMRIT